MITRRNFIKGLAALTIGNSAFGVSSTYGQKSGRRVSDGLDYLISKDYMHREEQWKRDMNDYKNAQKEKPIINGIQRVGDNENVTSLVSNDTDEKVKLSVEYTTDDFRKVYGEGKWNTALSKNEQERTENTYKRLGLGERKIICELHESPYAFYASQFTAEQQKRFDAFNNALKYLYSVNGKDGALKSHLQVFNPSNGATTEYFKGIYPWISLDKKNVPLNTADRVLVFWAADYLETKKGKRILNWDNIGKLSREKVSENF